MHDAGVKRSFPPVVGPRPRVLILGSLPGEASLRLGQYYGHPRNRFWELLGEALGEDLRALPYRRRLARLKARGVALWDMVARAERRGSLDARIRNERHNEVAALIARTGVRAVFLNGRKAAEAFRRACGEPEGVAVTVLPSTSPANAAVSGARKRAAWRRIAGFL
ncbi:MAG: DNA-deoxyinosine glycosylase [Elusimicrobia bacterium]|nr:DNA-deoxyinosine glycosylase [Elusimicrobiota bacterium]